MAQEKSPSVWERFKGFFSRKKEQKQEPIYDEPLDIPTTNSPPLDSGYVGPDIFYEEVGPGLGKSDHTYEYDDPHHYKLGSKGTEQLYQEITDEMRGQPLPKTPEGNYVTSEEVQQPNTEPTYETPVPLANQEKPYASLNGLQKRHSDMQQALQNPISVNEGIKKPGVVGKIVAEIEKKAQQTQQTQRRTPKPTGMIR